MVVEIQNRKKDWDRNQILKTEFCNLLKEY